MSVLLFSRLHISKNEVEIIMGNFIDYIKWRGDISMDMCPVNKIDVLALTILSYGIFEGIVTDGDESVTIKEAAVKYRKLHPEEKGENYDLLNSKTFGPYILYEMAETKRFGELKLSHYEDIFDESESIQYAAYQVEMPGGIRLLSFRGTDSAIDGWREDFAISFTQVGAQKLAYEYLNKNLVEGYRYIVSGHSKGGHLAEYAAMECEDNLKPLIDMVYSFDGPGMCPEFIHAEKLALIKDRIERIAPAHSVVGMLFRDSEPDVIVKSNGSTILQHAAFTWLLEGTEFLTQEKLDPAAAEIHKNISEWIDDESLEQRQAFTNELFDAFKAGGAIDIQGVAAGGVAGIQKIVKSLTSLDQDAKDVTLDLIMQAATGITGTVKNTTKESISTLLLNVGIWYSVISMVIGVFLLGFPKLSSGVLGFAFILQLFSCSVFALVTSIIFKKKQLIGRIVVCVLGIVLAAACLVYFRLWTVSSGIIIIFTFAVMSAFRFFNVINKRDESKATRRLWIIDGGISLLLAVVTIVAILVGFLEVFLKIAGMYLIFMSGIEFAREYLAREMRIYTG